MLLQRFEDADLSHYSYAVGCAAEAAVAIVDPGRDVDRYLAWAAEQGVSIRHVLETHIHADFASGAEELACLSGAELRVSAYDSGETFEVAFPHTDFRDGDAIWMGGVRIQALHTPGHTPEHLAYLVFDTHRSPDVPQLMLSGDFLFVGSVGRPDLLGEEAKLALANRLYDSIQNALAPLPDGLEIHPAHGSGSMCGAGISGRATSTLGFERIANPYLQPLSREGFVHKVLAEVPPFPDYYRRMKALNSAGPAHLHDVDPPAALDPAAFQALLDQGHVVVDVRAADAYAEAHLPGSWYVGHRPAMWGSWTVPYDTPLLLVADDAPHALRAWYRGLARVGLDDVRGYLAGGIDAWRDAGLTLQATEQVEPEEAAGRLASGEVVGLVDVRGAAMYEGGHAEGAIHVPASRVAERLAEIPTGEVPVAVVCNSGFQSTVVASVLERSGRADVVNVRGGMQAWRAADLPLTSVDEPQHVG